MGENGGAQELDWRVAGEGPKAVELLVEDELRDAADEDRGANSNDDERDHGRATGGSMASLLSATPTAAVPAMAISAASGSGRPAMCVKTVIMPPSITNSPWAKYDVRGVVDDGEAEGDQRVDRADRYAGQEELHEFGHRRGAQRKGIRRSGDGLGAGRGLLDEGPGAVLDLEHAEGREVEAEVVLRGHGDDAGGASEARRRLDGVADRLRLG